MTVKVPGVTRIEATPYVGLLVGRVPSGEWALVDATGPEPALTAVYPNRDAALRDVPQHAAAWGYVPVPPPSPLDAAAGVDIDHLGETALAVARSLGHDDCPSPDGTVDVDADDLLALVTELKARRAAADVATFTCRVERVGDGEFVATVAEFPSLSWLAETRGGAIGGLGVLLGEVTDDPELASA